MMIAVAYVRVSTEEQDLDTQVHTIKDWASKNGISIVKWYHDHGVSGATPLLERPGFRTLVSELGSLSPRPNLLLVYDISRLARSLRELVLAWDFIENKLDLVLIPVRDIHIFKIPIEYRNILRVLLATFSEIERELIRRRTRDAMRRLKKEGKILNVVERLLRDNPKLVEEICREYESGVPKYRLAKKNGLTLYAVDRVIREYCGHSVEMSCPRCMHLMTVEKRDVSIEDGRVIVRIVYYCRKCGYVQEIVRGG
ncbi:MAG: recombinase family protein [Crenarchaeota archaeon]|nr:recombinase family protein [Thermoproteota archaeon]